MPPSPTESEQDATIQSLLDKIARIDAELAELQEARDAILCHYPGGVTATGEIDRRVNLLANAGQNPQSTGAMVVIDLTGDHDNSEKSDD